MAGAIAARQEGDDYQAYWFWLQACRLFHRHDHVRCVGFELSTAKAFDDVVVFYDTPVPDRETGVLIQADYYQSKYHVNSGSFTWGDLIDPEFINASAISLLERVRDAQQQLAPDGKGVRFHLLTTWTLHSADPLNSILTTDGRIDWKKFSRGGPKSRLGIIREEWKSRLGIKTDEELEVILRPFRITKGQSFSQLRDEVSARLYAAGLQPIDMSKATNRYPDLVWTWSSWNRHEFTPEELRNLCEQEGLFREDYDAGSGSSETSASEIFQLISDREDFKRQYATAEEGRLQARYARVRIDVNSGYAESVRGEIYALVDDMRRITDVPLATELQGKIYRLAAAVSMPYLPGGDAATTRKYLQEARRFSEGESLAQCYQIDVLLTYELRGLGAALTLMDALDFRGPEADRLRFAFFAEAQDIGACKALLEGLENKEVLSSKEWARPLALYYAEIDDDEHLQQTLAHLTGPAADASDYSVAGRILVRSAYYRFETYCRVHNICPEAHLALGLGLGAFVNHDARHKAAEMYKTAALLYKQHGCIQEAVDSLSNAIRVSVDTRTVAPPEDLVRLLAELDPTHPFVSFSREGRTFVDTEAQLAQARAMLANPTVDANSILDVVAAASAITSITTEYEPEKALELARLLQEHRERFIASDDLHVHYLHMLFGLYMQASRQAEAEAWLAAIRPPERYAHLRPLLNALYYLARDSAEADRWVQDALQQYPNHPEVLAVAVYHYDNRRDYQEQLKYARALYEVTPTPAAAGTLLDVLINAEEDDEYLRLAHKMMDILPADILHRRCAELALRLGNFPVANEHLNWLRQNNLAIAQHLIRLSETYELLGETEEAIAVLRECIRKYPQEPDAYLELSSAYLRVEKYYESYQYARDAQQQFPEDKRINWFLFRVSFPSGYDTEPEVEQALRDFMPEEGFADPLYMTMMTVDELKEQLPSFQESGMNLWSMYLQGRLPFQMVWLLQQKSAFRTHEIFLKQRYGRYVTDSVRCASPEWLEENRPAGVMLDYSALLTLRSMYGDRWLEFLRGSFGHVWVSSTLPSILLWEHNQLAQYGQPERNRAKVAIRDSFANNPAKFTLHRSNTKAEEDDIVGTAIDRRVAASGDYVYLNDYATVLNITDPNTAGLVLIAEALSRAGKITPVTKQKLIKHANAPDSLDESLIQQLTSGSEIVVDVTTLEQIALADREDSALAAFLNYFGTIHLAQPAWQRMQNEIADFEQTRKLERELHRLRTQLGSGIRSRFISAESAPKHLLWLDPHGEIGDHAERNRSDDGATNRADYEVDSAQTQAGPNVRNQGDARDGILNYWVECINDTLGIAQAHNISIWTDDRFMSSLSPGDRSDLKNIVRFSTDTFLRWKRLVPPLESEFFEEHGKLIEWGYVGTLFSPEYIMWLLKEGYTPDSQPVVAAITTYRQNLLTYLDPDNSGTPTPNPLGLAAFQSYTAGASDTLLRCYQEGVSIETAAALYKAMDIPERFPLAANLQTLYLTRLLFDSLFEGSNQTEPTDGGDEGYVHWLNQIIQHTGVPDTSIHEQWYRIFALMLGVHSSPDEAIDQVMWELAILDYYRRLPEDVREFLLTGDLGEGLRTLLEDEDDKILFQLDVPNAGPVHTIVGAETWERDLNMALATFIKEGTQETVTAGAVTLHGSWVGTGSMFIRIEAVPTKFHKEYPEARGKNTQIACILNGATKEDVGARLAFWRQGREKLVSLNLPTEYWDSLREALTSTNADESSAAGRKLCHYLLSQASVATSYIGEACRLGAQVLNLLLSFITPELVREWVGLEKLGWEHGKEALLGLAQLQAAGQQRDNDPGRALPSREWLRLQVGYSIFPDAAMRQKAAVDAFAADRDSFNLSEVLDRLLELAESSRSLSFKANTILLVVALDASDPEQGLNSSTQQRLDALISQVANPWKGGVDEDADSIFEGVEQSFCDRLYTDWRGSERYRALTSRELLYLAHAASGHIVDALGSLPQSASTRLVNENNAWVLRQWIANPGSHEQPAGIIRPAWGKHIHYPFAYMVGRLLKEGQPVVLARAVRLVLLQTGLLHRVIQAYMCNLETERDWLDGDVPVDIAEATADLVLKWSGEPEEGDEGDKNQEVEETLLIMGCASPAGGTDHVQQKLASLPSAEEAEVINTVINVFYAGPCWNEGTFQLVRQLLEAENLQAIEQLPEAYSHLLLGLLELLLTVSALPSDLDNHVREALFGIPIGAPKVGQLLDQQAILLSKIVGFSRYVADVQLWLRAILAEESVPVAEVQKVIRQFTTEGAGYPQEIQQSIRPVLTEMVNHPRIRTALEL